MHTLAHTHELAGQPQVEQIIRYLNLKTTSGSDWDIYNTSHGGIHVMRDDDAAAAANAAAADGVRLAKP